MLTHDELLNDINTCHLAAGTSALWWLGQHSSVAKLADKVLYFDPFLSEHSSRLIPPLLYANEVVNYLGYIVEYANQTLYHSGDTCIYEGLLSRFGDPSGRTGYKTHRTKEKCEITRPM